MPRPYGLTYNEGHYGNERFGFGDITVSDAGSIVGAGPNGPDVGTDVYGALVGNVGPNLSPGIDLSASTVSSEIAGGLPLSMQLSSFMSNYGGLILVVGVGLVALSLMKGKR